MVMQCIYSAPVAKEERPEIVAGQLIAQRAADACHRLQRIFQDIANVISDLMRWASVESKEFTRRISAADDRQSHSEMQAGCRGARVTRIVKRRISQPKGRIEKLLFDLRGPRKAKSPTKPMIVFIKRVVEVGNIRRISQHNGGNSAGQMPHVVPAQRAIFSTEAMRAVSLQLKQNSRCLQTAASEHIATRMDADRRRCIAVDREATNRVSVTFKSQTRGDAPQAHTQ